MIPYIEIDKIHLFGPFTLQPFGVLVATGIAMGAWFVKRRARQYGRDPEELTVPIWVAVVVGIFLSHAFDVIWYFPERISEQGIVTLFKFWEGLSSFGGFFGAAIGLGVYYKVTKKPFLPDGDIIVQGLVLGWIFGRAGCSVVHDHPGALSDFFLAVNYPGGARHDLGFYEFLYTVVVLFPMILLMHRHYSRKAATAAISGGKKSRRKAGKDAPGAVPAPPPGTYLAAVCVAYAPVRFLMDTLRATDVANADKRYLGLTPGQYSAMFVLAVGLGLFWHVRKKSVPSAVAASSA